MSAAKERTYNDAEIAAKIQELGLAGWYLEDGWLRRKYNTDGWPQTLMVVNAIGYLCEAAYHHADLAVTWGKLWVKLQDALGRRHHRQGFRPGPQDRGRGAVAAEHGRAAAPATPTNSCSQISPRNGAPRLRLAANPLGNSPCDYSPRFCFWCARRSRSPNRGPRSPAARSMRPTPSAWCPSSPATPRPRRHSFRSAPPLSVRRKWARSRAVSRSSSLFPN